MSKIIILSLKKRIKTHLYGRKTILSKYKLDFKEQVMSILGTYTHHPIALLLRDTIVSDYKEDSESLAVWSMVKLDSPYMLGCKLSEYVFEAEGRERELDSIALHKSMELGKPFQVDRTTILNEAEFIYATILRQVYLIYLNQPSQTWKQYQELVDYTQYFDFLIEVIDRKNFFGFQEGETLASAVQVGKQALEEFLAENQTKNSTNEVKHARILQ
jgi:hypothetical protein